jgi:outer membrane protein OmpA-like peptidoglycan-associated protein
MKHSTKFQSLVKRPLMLAVIAALAAGCATPEQSAPEQVSWAGPVGATGPAGMQGPTGATGARGATGETGAQGASIAGPAGARGATGAAGAAGAIGSTGADGLTTVGPTGPTGVAGTTGAQGVTGYSGARGSTEMAGVAGQRGSTGSAGPQGAAGATGVQGPMAAGGSWSPYRDYTFNTGSDAILASDGNKAWEIARYMNQNPSYRVAVDGPNGRRTSNVRDALIQAGVSAEKIQVGSFGDPQLRRDDRVAVLMSN